MSPKAAVLKQENAGNECVSTAKRSARDRIFATARDLFYKQGIRAVGVETIAAEAGTTKMSLYRHFPSKDELTAECLKADREDFNSWWNATVAKYPGEPRKQLEALFHAFETRTCQNDDGSRGCPLANAAVELTEEGHPARAVVLEHKTEIRRRMRALCREMKARDPDRLGDALMLLMEGSYVSRLVFGTTGPVEAVSTAAKVLIEEQLA